MKLELAAVDQPLSTSRINLPISLKEKVADSFSIMVVNVGSDKVAESDNQIT